MAKKKNTLQDLDAFLKSQPEEQKEAIDENTNTSFLEKEPTQLVEIEKQEPTGKALPFYGKRQTAKVVANESELYQALLKLAETRQTSPEEILKKLIGFREEEMANVPEPSWWDWVSQTSSSLWQGFFDK